MTGFVLSAAQQMAEQLGLQSLTIPEEYGGQGFGYVELIVVLEEMGKTLVCAEVVRRMALEGGAFRAVMLAHRAELLEQGAGAMERHTGLPTGIEAGDLRAGIGGIITQPARD